MFYRLLSRNEFEIRTANMFIFLSNSFCFLHFFSRFFPFTGKSGFTFAVLQLSLSIFSFFYFTSVSASRNHHFPEILIFIFCPIHFTFSVAQTKKMIIFSFRSMVSAVTKQVWSTPRSTLDIRPGRSPLHETGEKNDLICF